jgi:hypothetical protein
VANLIIHLNHCQIIIKRLIHQKKLLFDLSEHVYVDFGVFSYLCTMLSPFNGPHIATSRSLHDQFYRVLQPD